MPADTSPHGAEVADPLIGRLVHGYQVTRVIGSGGMGIVYEAIHPVVGQRAALKCLIGEHATDTDAIARFIDEARAASAVQHPNLVKIYNCGRLEDGTHFILMEFLAGESLRERLERSQAPGTQLSMCASLRIAREVAAALEAVHQRGIVHRDLKPGNVFLVHAAAGDDAVRVVDFGIAKISHEDGGAARQTTEGKFLGTVVYASPEQCRMDGNIGTASDVYSLGIMLYEMLTGKPPFLGGMGTILGAHLFKEPPALRGTAARLVHTMLAKAPASRPAMTEVVAALDQLLRDASRQRSLVLRPGLVLLCIACLLILAATWETARRTPERRFNPRGNAGPPSAKPVAPDAASQPPRASPAPPDHEAEAFHPVSKPNPRRRRAAETAAATRTPPAPVATPAAAPVERSTTVQEKADEPPGTSRSARYEPVY